MTRSCRQCNQAFEITDSDLEFYEKLSPVFAGKKELIPAPTLCPECRQRRRLSFRNERKLYNDNCDLCKKDIVSLYSPESPNPVYCSDCFWSDKWDPLSYGREFDFSKSFTQQLRELSRAVPYLNISSLKSVNCDYNNYTVESKDCYLSFRVGGSEKVLYSYLAIHSLSCVDCFNIFECKYCYECIDCEGCYQTRFSARCKNVNDSDYCYDCVGCADCFGCSGLRNKRHCFLNEQLTPTEYAAKIIEVKKDRKAREAFRQEFMDKVYLKKPHKNLFILNSENPEGDCVTNSKNVSDSFDVDQSEDVRHSWGVEHARDVSDGSFIYYGEKCHEAISNSHSTDMLFSFGAYDSRNLICCIMCYAGSHDLFGCVNAKKAQYCILNKQYTKEEYEELAPKIIEHMRRGIQGSEFGIQENTNASPDPRIPTPGFLPEWGEFLDPSLSLFGYNETVAQEYLPLEKDEALKLGFAWMDYVAPAAKVEKTVAAEKIPDRIEDIPDAILDWAVECEISKRPFRITKMELQFLREHGLPLPRRHPDIRHLDRMKLRNPRKLFERNCMKCGKEIQTSYAPDRKEIVYCEECYLKEVY